MPGCFTDDRCGCAFLVNLTCFTSDVTLVALVDLGGAWESEVDEDVVGG